MNDFRKDLENIKDANKYRILQDAALEQLLCLNSELLQKLKATEQSHRSLMNYITEMHKTLEDNFNRTPIEEIWFKELSRYLKSMLKVTKKR